MTTTTLHGQVPEALRLADLFELERDPESLYRQSAAELRRQHARIAELEAQVEALSAAPACDERVPEAWTNLLAYVLQDDMHNRLTPRVIDISYTAFNLAKQPNPENGGASDWFNDTKPTVAKMIAQLRKDLIKDCKAPPTPSAEQQTPGWHAPGLGEVHSNDHNRMIYCTDGEDVVDDALAQTVCSALNAIRQPDATTGASSGGVYAELPEPTTHQIAELKACEHGDAIVGWRVEPSRQSFHASMHPKRTLYTTEQARNFADRTHALRMKQADPNAAPAWEHHARKLTQWLHCMSYNDSYFGEPAGLVKQVTGELNRLVGAAPQQEAPKAAPAKAADSAPEDAGGANWQDISTAPKDGTRFVAVGNNYGLYSETQHVCIAQWFRGCWMEASDWNETSELKYLTHWMPLPPLPGNAARKQGGA